MSMYLEFEPHSWYMGFAIKLDNDYNDPCEWDENYTDGKVCIVHDCLVHKWENYCPDYAPKWSAYTDDGNTYQIDELGSNTLASLKEKIRQYHLSHKNGYGERLTKRLEATA